MIRVLKPGLWSSLQDRGRLGYRSLGVPLSGVMDALSADFANQLVGNPLSAAVLEFTAMGPELLFDKDAVIAITGATFGILINDCSKPINSVINISAGDTLKFTAPKNGWRGYLAIQAGFMSEVVLGSKSMYQGITKKGRIEKEDVLKMKLTSEILKPKNEALFPLKYESNIIEVFEGPEYEILDDKTKEKLSQNIFSIHQHSNRMATQIDGLGEVRFEDILTVPVQPGTVQLTPTGRLLILMRDAQTTGGYPRVFQLTKHSLNILAQKRPNDNILFKVID